MSRPNLTENTSVELEISREVERFIVKTVLFLILVVTAVIVFFTGAELLREVLQL